MVEVVMCWSWSWSWSRSTRRACVRRSRIVALGLAALLAAPLGSCSAVLGGLGALSDANHPRPGTLAPEQVALVRGGTPMTIRLKDGGTLAGTFTGTRPIAAAEYERLYDAWRAASPDADRWPALGDATSAYSRHGMVVGTGQFDGFTVSGFLLARPSGAGPAREFRLAQFDSIRAGGLLLPGDRWGRDLADSGAPLSTQILVRPEGSREARAVSWQDVASVEIGNGRHAARRGIFTGLLVDGVVAAVVIAAIAVAWANQPPLFGW
jgi:hypothetical protein